MPSPPLLGPYGPEAEGGLVWTDVEEALPGSGRGRVSMRHRSDYGQLGNNLLTDLDGFVPEPGDRWQDFAWPEDVWDELWALEQAGDPAVEQWWDEFVAEAYAALEQVRAEYEAENTARLGSTGTLEEPELDPYVLLDYTEWLQGLDYGLGAEDPDIAEGLLLELEAVADNLAEETGLVLPELTLAIRYFLTEPERSRSYLYGPTDIRSGTGAIEQLKALVRLDEP